MAFHLRKQMQCRKSWGFGCILYQKFCWVNLIIDKIWANLVRFGQIWLNYGQNQNLASPKHPIFYGYEQMYLKTLYAATLLYISYYGLWILQQLSILFRLHIFSVTQNFGSDRN